MEFYTFSYDRTPKIGPRISYKVLKLAKKLLREMVWKPYKIGDRYPPTKKTMQIVLTTGERYLDEMRVFGPFTKCRGIVDFALWIPYNRLAEHENHLEPFLKYYFDGMVQVFGHYGVPEEAVRKVQKEVEAETIGNPEYVYVDYEPWLDK